MSHLLYGLHSKMEGVSVKKKKILPIKLKQRLGISELIFNSLRTKDVINKKKIIQIQNNVP